MEKSYLAKQSEIHPALGNTGLGKYSDNQKYLAIYQNKGKILIIFDQHMNMKNIFNCKKKNLHCMKLVRQWWHHYRYLLSRSWCRE